MCGGNGTRGSTPKGASWAISLLVLFTERRKSESKAEPPGTKAVYLCTLDARQRQHVPNPSRLLRKSARLCSSDYLAQPCEQAKWVR